MGRMDVGQAFAPAYNHMVTVLFKPFQFKKWLALGFAAMLSYGGSGGNFNIPGGGGPDGSGGRHPELQAWAWIVQHLPIVVAAGIALLAIALLLAWLTCVFRFVYTDQISRNSGAIREPFARFKKLGSSFFQWQLVLGFLFLIVVAGLAMLIVWAFVLVPNSPGSAKALSVIAAICFGIPFMILAAIVETFAGDFVVTVMYARGIRVIEAWRIVCQVLSRNVGQSALYLLLLIAFGIGIGIASLLAVLATGLVVAIPLGLLALIGYFIWMAVHLTWTPATIAVAVTLGTAAALGWAYLAQCAMQPFVVFRRTYTLVLLGQADESLVTIGRELGAQTTGGPSDVLAT